ncbi:hypothetical protein jhhlp_001361 [Lomentospora prolificans]|uniref:Elongator complex protein 6 n=1 Tax=Lomentospora prolificans TaxID=41688 RepID=A0A2N3NI04_9PEZI|nr:hypothetical protein jhhlp_001361 [Lomentospora prolificans]
MSTRTPHLLEPYLPLSPSSLTLLTSVLGATTNWLLLRFLAHHLARPTGSDGDSDGDGGYGEAVDDRARKGGDKAVVFVSFMRDYAFWKEGAARLGVDLDLAINQETLIFIDGLTGLFVPAPRKATPQPSGRRTLRSGKLADIRTELDRAVDDIGSVQSNSAVNRKIVLIIDQPDSYLAMTSSQNTPGQITDMIISLREKVHAAILTMAVDEPLIESQSTTLERCHASLALSTAHEARLVLSLRRLDTGVATDVSGVLRITRGGAYEEGIEKEDEEGEEVEAHEYLYFVAQDGGVKIFERGQ